MIDVFVTTGTDNDFAREQAKMNKSPENRWKMCLINYKSLEIVEHVYSIEIVVLVFYDLDRHKTAKDSRKTVKSNDFDKK